MRAAGDARAPGADEPLGLLVKPDRHVGAQPPDQPASQPGLGLRERRLAGMLGIAGCADRPPAGGEVAVQVDAAGVRAACCERGRRGSGCGPTTSPSPRRRQPRGDRADRLDPGALVAVDAADREHQRPALALAGPVRAAARIGRPSDERPIVTCRPELRSSRCDRPRAARSPRSGSRLGPRGVGSPPAGAAPPGPRDPEGGDRQPGERERDQRTGSHSLPARLAAGLGLVDADEPLEVPRRASSAAPAPDQHRRPRRPASKRKPPRRRSRPTAPRLRHRRRGRRVWRLPAR